MVIFSSVLLHGSPATSGAVHCLPSLHMIVCQLCTCLRLSCQLRLLVRYAVYRTWLFVSYAYGNMSVLSIAVCTFVHDRSSAVYLVVYHMLFVYSTIPPFNPLYSVIHQPHAYIHMYGYKLYYVHLFIFFYYNNLLSHKSHTYRSRMEAPPPPH